MSGFEIKRINVGEEIRIISAMIQSKELLNAISSVYNSFFFKNRHARFLADMIVNYFDVYAEAPQTSIEDLVLKSVGVLGSEDFNAVEGLVARLIDTFGITHEINHEYVIDQTLAYFKKRNLEIHVNNIQHYLEKNDVDKAEDQLLGFNKVSRLTSDWRDPFTKDAIDIMFKDRRELLQFPGALGEFLGSFERGWSVGITGPFKSGKCISKDSKIQLANGDIKTIEDIVRNKDKDIIALNDDLQFEFDTVIDWFDNGIKPVFKVITRTGRSVKVTMNHPFFTIEGWKQLHEITVGDRIAVPKKVQYFGNYSCPYHKSAMLAYLLADGGITQGTFTFHKLDENLKIDFRKCVAAFGDEITVLNELTDYIVSGNNTKSNIRKWFDKLKLTGLKSKDKFIPEIVYSFNRESLITFLSVLFSCDGSIYKIKSGRNIEYCSASIKLMNSICPLLTRFGILYTVRNKIIITNGKKYKAQVLTISDSVSVNLFLKTIGFKFSKHTTEQEIEYNRSLIDLFYVPKYILKKTMNLVSSNLKETVRQAIKNNGGITREKIKEIYNKTGINYFKILAESNIIFDEIKSIEFIGNEQTYDITVKNNHNFIADNMIVHNTWTQQEFAIQGLINQKKVAFYSLEMTYSQMFERTYKRLFPCSTFGGDVVIPVFDCSHNQDGSCNNIKRKSSVALIGKDKPQYRPGMNYVPCSECRGTEFFEMSTWFDTITVPEFDRHFIASKLKTAERFYKDYLYLKTYPRFSANLSDILRDLDILEQRHDFIPDIIVVDYADILKSEDGSIGVDKEDKTWMALSRLAAERKCLVVTGTQGNKESMNAKNVTSEHTARWVGKLGHIDVMLALNQTKDEKKQGIMRISTMSHRHHNFNELDTVSLLQCLNIGQPHLDSYYK